MEGRKQSMTKGKHLNADGRLLDSKVAVNLRNKWGMTGIGVDTSTGIFYLCE